MSVSIQSLSRHTKTLSPVCRNDTTEDWVNGLNEAPFMFHGSLILNSISGNNNPLKKIFDKKKYKSLAYLEDVENPDKVSNW